MFTKNQNLKKTTFLQKINQELNFVLFGNSDIKGVQIVSTFQIQLKNLSEKRDKVMY